jgi:hypothetical protein
MKHMASSVKLISKRRIPEASDENEFTWAYETNDTWIPFSDGISSSIEKAFQQGSKEIFIDGIYRIDLEDFVRENVNDQKHKQSIRRRRVSKSSFSNEDESRRNERFSFHLECVSRCSASADTNYYGSPFIAEWYLTFTKGKRNITFDSIFHVLVQGLREEGPKNESKCVDDIVNNLNKIRDEVLQKSEKQKMEELENYCARLYTKSCFIHRIVNIALRNNDHTKQRTLGPYCLLVFNYIGRHVDDDFSIRRRLRQSFRSTKPQLMTVFRGDCISREMIEEYQQAVGNKSKYFKWLPFVSTSRDQTVAECFLGNVLYKIQLERSLLKDQLVDISSISSFNDEEEILLQPGVRFQVDKVELDKIKYLPLVSINIVPSYVSTLR